MRANMTASLFGNSPAFKSEPLIRHPYRFPGKCEDKKALLSQILAKQDLNGAMPVKIHIKKALYAKTLVISGLWINHCGILVIALAPLERASFHKTGILWKFDRIIHDILKKHSGSQRDRKPMQNAV
jgi:hypothetical protein